MGAKSSAPTVDNDGDALQTGALYFNTGSDTMFIRTSGGSWTAAGSAVNGTTNRSSYVATANQTTFASVYDVGYLDVYLNGSIKHLTFSDPRASTEMAAHKAESIPPDNPSITPGKLFFST